MPGVSRLPRVARSPWTPFLVAVVLRSGVRGRLQSAVRQRLLGLPTSLLRDGSTALEGEPITDFEPLYPIFLAAARMLVGDHAVAVQMIQVVAASTGSICLYRLAITLDGRTAVAATASWLVRCSPVADSAGRSRQRPGACHDACSVRRVLLDLRGNHDASCPGRNRVGASRSHPFDDLAARALVRGVLVQRRYRHACAVAISALVFVLPIPMRSHAINGWNWPTRSGLNLYVGNSPYTAALLPDHDVDLLQEQAAAQIATEVAHLSHDSPAFSQAADAALARHALTYMAEDPLRTLGHKVLNVAVLLFSPPRPVFHSG